jgi:hypothetical protein
LGRAEKSARRQQSKAAGLKGKPSKEKGTEYPAAKFAVPLMPGLEGSGSEGQATTSTSGHHPQGRKGEALPEFQKAEFQKIVADVILVEAIARSRGGTAICDTNLARGTPLAGVAVNQGRRVDQRLRHDRRMIGRL